MKKNIIALVLLVSVIAYLVFMLFYIGNVKKDFSNDLGQMIDKINLENYEEAMDSLRQIKEKWDKKTPMLASYYDHDDLELFNTALSETETYLELRSKNDSYRSVKRLLFLFEHIYDSEQINIENIL